jgi:hypothetical protein
MSDDIHVIRGVARELSSGNIANVYKAHDRIASALNFAADSIERLEHEVAELKKGSAAPALKGKP